MENESTLKADEIYTPEYVSKLLAKINSTPGTREKITEVTVKVNFDNHFEELNRRIRLSYSEYEKAIGIIENEINFFKVPPKSMTEGLAQFHEQQDVYVRDASTLRIIKSDIDINTDCVTFIWKRWRR